MTDEKKDASGPTEDGGYIIDDSTLAIPSREEIEEELRRLRIKRGGVPNTRNRGD